MKLLVDEDLAIIAAMRGESIRVTVTETRKLAAIMFTDMVGFSRQMGVDEARMLGLLDVVDWNIWIDLNDEEYGRINPNRFVSRGTSAPATRPFREKRPGGIRRLRSC